MSAVYGSVFLTVLLTSTKRHTYENEYIRIIDVGQLGT